jgi:heavy metal sensor kinase
VSFLSRAPGPDVELPDWIRSIRVRYTVLYSAVLFGLAALLVGSLYLGLSIKLQSMAPESYPITALIQGPYGGYTGQIDAVTTEEFQRRINANTLDQLRDFSFIALGVLFVASLAVGWVISGQVLAPIARITDVARDIQATDLGRRIRLQGPDDELKQLADTFDAMLYRLDAAFKAQERFVADASHELRNPLAVIRTNIDVALSDDRASVEDLRQTAGVVRRASDRMAGIVDDLLLMARRQAPLTQRDPVDLASVLAEEADEFAAAAKKKGIVLERLAPPGIMVTGDRDALKRAVANLLENAIRYTPAKGRIRMACGRERTWAWITVIDNGPGIAAEHHERVFDRFWRADKARSRAEGGTGLGLAIVRQIARTHGGEVQLRSKPGEGATFVLWLPLGPAREQPGKTRGPAAAAGGGSGPSSGGVEPGAGRAGAGPPAKAQPAGSGGAAGPTVISST